MLTCVLLQVREEHHDEADGEEVDGEEGGERPARRAPTLPQRLGVRILIVVEVCGGEVQVILVIILIWLMVILFSPH